MALSRYVDKKFGMKTRSYPITDPVKCLETVTTILKNNPDRLGVILVNLGAVPMYIAWNRDVDEHHGIYIAASGGSFTMIADEDGELVGYELFGIAIGDDTEIFTMVTEAESGA